MITLIQKYDKLSHLIIGVVCGLFNMDWRLFAGIITVKEIYDTYKPNPTGFDLQDWFAGFGGYWLGLYINNLFK